jgi:hypothetical protein
VLPDGFTTTGSNTFINCPSLTRIYFPSSTNVIGGNVFMDCGQLMIEVSEDNPWFCSIDGVLFNKAQTKLIEYAKDKLQQVYEVPSGVTNVGNYAFYNRKQMTSITFPSTLTRLGNDVVSMCQNISSLTFHCVNAPSLDNESVFGATNTAYTGRNTYSAGTNKLRIPFNASGFETGLWLDPLQNASKCGFSIHGKLILSSNRSDAQFSIQYTTEAGVSKTVTVGVGTCYLSDIKYGTSLTATPKTLGDNVFDSASTTITYNGATTITNNAYIYPKNATIVGEQNPTKNPTYTWTTSTANVDGSYTGVWSLSGDITTYLSIASQNTDSCTLSIREVPTEEISGTLTLVLTPAKGTAVTTTKSLKAILEGVVITSKSNAPIQASLYAAGLVANETYSMQEEVEKITANQLLTGTSNSSSIFIKQKDNITHFEEFEYFTGVTEIKNYTFAHCTKLQTLHIPHSVTSIDFLGFYKSNKIEFTVSGNNQNFSARDGVLYNKTGETLVFYRKADTVPNYDVPYGVTALAFTAFRDTTIKTIVLPETVTTMGITSLAFNRNLTSVNIPSGVTTLPDSLFSECKSLSSITIPAGVTQIGDSCFSLCSSLSEIIMLGATAPVVKSYTFGGSSTYTGKNTASAGTNTLRIPLNATGYEASYWLDPLQNSSACGFHIHGKLVITSNKSAAQFSVSYTTESGTLKTVTVGVGTWYLNDIKYSTSITIAAITLSGYTWAEQTKTFTYSKTANTADFNAYIYPTSVTISGDSVILGGKQNDYYASVAPSNIDIGFTYNWAIEGSTNVSIESYSENLCTIKAQSVDEDDECTLTCTIKTADGKNISSSINVKINVYRSLITAVYGPTSSNEYVLNSSYDVSNILYMEKNGVRITPAVRMYLSSSSTTTIKMVLKDLRIAFRSTNVTSLDFSECDGTEYDSMSNTFYYCTKLTSINWGQCKFPNIKSLSKAFSYCTTLPNIDLTPFSGAPINDIISAFDNCQIIENLDLSPLSGIVVSSLDHLCSYCKNLKSIDLTPLSNSEITSYEYMFQGALNLGTIIAPWKKAPSMSGYPPFGGSVSSYTGYNTRSAGTNKLYVPADATGYNTGHWLDPLQNAEKCGFTLSATL